MKTIAIVEDDEYIGNMLAELLGASGYKTVRAYSGSEALLLLEREKPDLILLDLMLPGVSGEAVLERVAGVN
ncbi:MAG TPA: response regulator [Candidatus Borkfalkia excrementigallinarum]|uniref:Stage 0 sporulation protein A homolog n=1 Tax=Candidatus Borkfalkia excrementigallinarum TaxID=2838506 RepID=A0A9D2CSM5_9FIRM|nr:response regulator [Candidatus Borkfalkia excrementigallinarum]